jgi:3-oxoacyl-[acyl-carrier protein] reductase
MQQTMQKVAVVTGAGQGVGEQIARTLHAEGYRVALADIQEDTARAVAQDLDPSEESTRAYRVDVRDKSDFEAVRDDVAQRWGGATALVNNAGVSQAAALMEITPEEFSAVVQVNLNGVFLGCQVFGAAFAHQGFGRIVNMASLAGQNGGTATGGHYAASKGGIATLTKVFARELAARGVTVNAVSPGPMDLPVVHRTVGEENLEAFARNIPVGRLGSPTFIARTVALLLSEDAAFVTGACWDVNGGLYMR